MRRPTGREGGRWLAGSRRAGGRHTGRQSRALHGGSGGYTGGCYRRAPLPRHLSPDAPSPPPPAGRQQPSQPSETMADHPPAADPPPHEHEQHAPEQQPIAPVAAAADHDDDDPMRMPDLGRPASDDLRSAASPSSPPPPPPPGPSAASSAPPPPPAPAPAPKQQQQVPRRKLGGFVGFANLPNQVHRKRSVHPPSSPSSFLSRPPFRPRARKALLGFRCLRQEGEPCARVGVGGVTGRPVWLGGAR